MLIEHRQGNVGHQRRQDAPNAMGNFSFEVTLSYRLPMKSRRQQRGTDKS